MIVIVRLFLSMSFIAIEPKSKNTRHLIHSTIDNVLNYEKIVWTQEYKQNKRKSNASIKRRKKFRCSFDSMSLQNAAISIGKI